MLLLPSPATTLVAVLPASTPTLTGGPVTPPGERLELGEHAVLALRLNTSRLVLVTK
jgi:hypothetical protein